MNQSHKGQVFSTDFAASLLVFSVLLTAFIITWNMALATPEDVSEQELRSEAYRTADLMIQTQGEPSDWDADPPTPTFVGFATEKSYVLNETKMSEFEQLSYNEQEELLDAPDFQLTITNMETGDTLLEEGEDFSDAETVIPITRYATVPTANIEERDMVEVEYTVWQ